MQRDVRSAIVRYVLDRQRDPLLVLAPDGSPIEANRSAHALGLDLIDLFQRRHEDDRVQAFLDELRFEGSGSLLVAEEEGTVYRLEGSVVDGWSIVVAQPQVVSAEEWKEPMTMPSIMTGRSALPTSVRSDVLALARPRSPSLERIDVDAAIVEACPLIERVLDRDRVEVALALGAGSAQANVDRRSLVHSLLHLVLQANEVLGDGGRVVVASCTAQDGSRPVVRVSVTAIGGRSSGTTVSIALPQCEPVSGTLDPQRRGEVVLVASPDPDLVQAVEHACENEGFVVLAAATQEEALGVAAEHVLDVALVDDVLMRRDPKTFLHRLRIRSPAGRLVLLSEALVGERRAEEAVLVLPKSFSDQALVSVLRRTSRSA
jgi:CheY-like chemotaxis protein